MDIIREARRVFDTEIQALQATRDSIDATFEMFLDKIASCKGKVIMTGMGKPGHIAKKIAATFSSLGTSSFFLDPAEAMHGDLGMVSSQDIVFMISYSGESDELVKIIPGIKLLGAEIIVLTGNGNSTLAKYADLVQVLPKFDEACYLRLAPTSSTTTALCYGDALAVLASERYGFQKTDFGKLHPAGALGKKLIYRVEDIMAEKDDNAVVGMGAHLKEAIVLLAKKKLGLVSVVDESNKLVGVITTGDLGRQLEKGADVYHFQVDDVMSRNPKTIAKGCLAIEALNYMKKYSIYSLPVMEGDIPIGTINMQMILNAGIVEEI